MGLDAYFKKQRERDKSRGGDRGDRIPFLSKPKRNMSAITFEGRLCLVMDEDGEEGPAMRYKKHGFGKNSSICRKTFDAEEHCDMCSECHAAYEAGDRDTGKELMGKSSYWLGFIPMMNGYDEKLHILDFPYGQTQKLFFALAFKGGWGNPELDWDDDECVAAIIAGIEKCYGAQGFQFSFHFNPNAPPQTMYTNLKLSTRKGRKVEIPETPDFPSLFKRVKKFDDDGGPQTKEPKAPAPEFEKMSKKEMMQYCDSMGIEYKKSWKVGALRKHLTEEVE